MFVCNLLLNLTYFKPLKFQNFFYNCSYESNKDMNLIRKLIKKLKIQNMEKIGFLTKIEINLELL